MAWPYASGLRHIGHVAGFGVPSDTFARYHRLRGNDVLMVSGTDEHGTPVMVARGRRRASRRVRPPTRFNRLIRRGPAATSGSATTSSRGRRRANHYRVTQDVFRTLYDKGYIVEQETLGAFSAATRPHAARPLHRGHLPDLRLRERARRPVRQLREPARPDRSDRPALAASTARRRCFETTKHLFLDLPAFKAQLTAWIESQQQLAPERQALLAQLRQGA